MRPDDIHPYLLPMSHQSHSDSNSAGSVPKLWDFADGMGTWPLYPYDRTKDPQSQALK
jgi:hypothetical protein